jgi:putative Holliday junction resolvase
MPVERTLGLDYGMRRIGVALSDPLGITAQPLGTVANRGVRALEEIAALVQKHQAVRLVIGLPRHMSGEEGVKAVEAREFGARLAEKINVPIEFMDERLTTMAVQRMLAETDMSGAKKRGVVDKLAAALILQMWMDRNRGKTAT